jgi:hypothetical protein
MNSVVWVVELDLRDLDQICSVVGGRDLKSKELKSVVGVFNWVEFWTCGNKKRLGSKGVRV